MSSSPSATSLRPPTWRLPASIVTSSWSISALEYALPSSVARSSAPPALRSNFTTRHSALPSVCLGREGGGQWGARRGASRPPTHPTRYMFAYVSYSRSLSSGGG